MTEEAKDGELTWKQREAITLFGYDALIPDPECFVSVEEAIKAFKAWSWNNYTGFDVDDYETFEAVITSLENRKIEPTDKDGDAGFRVRLVDDLGLKRFDPDELEDASLEYVVDRLLPAPGVHSLVSLPEARKTWVGLSFAVAVSRGEPWAGRYTTRKGRVAVVDFEMGGTELRRRLKLLGADERILHCSHPPHGLSQRFFDELAKAQVDFVFIDSLSGGNGIEFSETDTRFAEPLARAARFCESARRPTCVFTHHSAKAASLRDVESLFRGTGAIRSKVDSAFYFERVAGDPTRSRISSAKTRKGQPAEQFDVVLTDERGVEIVSGRTHKKQSMDELVRDFIRNHAGCSTSDIVTALGKRRAVVAARQQLENAGVIRAEGKGRAIHYFALE